MVAEKRYLYAADPQEQLRPPKEKEAVPFLDFSPLQNALARLEKAANAFTDSIAFESLEAEKKKEVNAILFRCEQELLHEGGLPRKPWYRHTIYSPGYYTGYGVKTLPGVREGIEQRNWSEARQQIDIAARAIQSYSERLEEAVAVSTKK
jgi:N-acetylated-alpha-linked acidic dipeptidase